MKKTLLLLFLAGICQIYAQELDIRPFATGFDRPLAITNPQDDRLFVVEQGGLVKIIQQDASVNQDVFLDLSTQVSSGGERGLLGLAFHPNYSENGYFYVSYTDTDGNTQISRFSVDQNNPDRADGNTELNMLSLEQPYENHNGGCLAFGADGYLYIGLGDGGGSGDPENRAQDTGSLYGSILRLDVNGDLPYAIPTDNPFVGDDAQRDEIWAYGLRNPWKFSFDSENGDLWIADVGQNLVEEINRATLDAGGLNYGWRCYEGNAVYNDTNCPESTSLTFPLATYNHELGRASVTGGYVYRGEEFSALQGRYVFADFVSNELAYVNEDSSISFFGPFENTGFSSFGVSNDASLYVAGISSGIIYQVVDANDLSITDNDAPEMKLFPNPARGGMVSVEIPLTNKNVSLSIFDILGKKVLSKSITSGKSQIDISTLKKGIYLAQFEGARATQKTQKLIVK